MFKLSLYISVYIFYIYLYIYIYIFIYIYASVFVLPYHQKRMKRNRTNKQPQNTEACTASSRTEKMFCSSVLYTVVKDIFRPLKINDVMFIYPTICNINLNHFPPNFKKNKKCES